MIDTFKAFVDEKYNECVNASKVIEDYRILDDYVLNKGHQIMGALDFVNMVVCEEDMEILKDYAYSVIFEKIVPLKLDNY